MEPVKTIKKNYLEVPNVYSNVIVSDNEINVPTVINIIIGKQEYNTKYTQCLQSKNDNLYNIIITRYKHLERHPSTVDALTETLKIIWACHDLITTINNNNNKHVPRLYLGFSAASSFARPSN